MAEAGRLDDALATINEGLTLAHETSEHYFIAELYRLKGELLPRSANGLAPATVALAEDCFAKALAIARNQQARSWELRIVTSLARLYCKQGRTELAGPLVERTYRWFSEGHDTADLKAAARLLDGLTRGLAHPPTDWSAFYLCLFSNHYENNTRPS